MKKISICFIQIMFLLGSCNPFQPATVQPGRLPTSTITFTPTFFPAITPALGHPEIENIYLEQIQMMDELSGWGWGYNLDRREFLLHTLDGGNTWKDVTPEKDLFPVSYSSFVLDTQTVWVVSADNRLLRTLDAGQTWQLVNQNLKNEFFSRSDWYRLRFRDMNHGWLEGGIAAAGAREFFYETEDGGLTWKPSNFKTLPAPYISEYSSNEIAFWIVTDVIYYDLERFIIAPALDEQEGTPAIFLSTDWGDNWKTVPLLPSTLLERSPSTREKISQPIFFDSLNGLLTVHIWDKDENTFNLFVYGTSDGGLTWTLASGPSLIEDARSEISFLSMQDAVFVCGVQFCVTNDSGKTWSTHEFGTDIPMDREHTIFQLDFIDPVTGWLLIRTSDDQYNPLETRILRTTDGGFAWMEFLPVIGQ